MSVSRRSIIGSKASHDIRHILPSNFAIVQRICSGRLLVSELAQPKYVMPAFNSKLVVRVLHNTQNLVISCCCCAEDDKDIIIVYVHSHCSAH